MRSVPGRIRAAAVGGAVAAAVAAAAVGPAASAAQAKPASEQAVIVQYDGSGAAAALRAVARSGGTVGRQLPVANAFAAQVPTSSLRALAGAAGVRQVTLDEQVTLKAGSWGPNSPDGMPMTTVTSLIGARDVWYKRDAKGQQVVGRGVGVALIDSGIVPVKGLDDAAYIVNGPDLSLDSQVEDQRSLDTFGHGTHLGGIISGHDPGLTDTAMPGPNDFVGVAPGAKLINIKVAAGNGAVDVSQVIAGIDWVVTHRNDPGLNIRVLNLSFGTDSVQDASLDPLSHAVEAAWRMGIVVVVSAGNEGPSATRLGMPAMNPYVLAVGASDSLGTASTKDDTVASFSSRGSSLRHADLVAPGRSIVSLRSPNSYLDTSNPNGRQSLSIDPTQRYLKGSGTSQAAAVVSGAAALLLQQRPNLTPDQVKRLLMVTADRLTTSDSISQGAGELNVAAASAAATPTYAQVYGPSRGTGSIEASRGTNHLVDLETGAELTGEQDIFGNAFNSAAWSATASAGSAWQNGTWNGAEWAGGDWTGESTLAGRTWAGRTWAGRTWAGRTWAGRTWAGAVWDGRTWAGAVWDGRTWAGSTWASTNWA